jgi:hypothetical protein
MAYRISHYIASHACRRFENYMQLDVIPSSHGALALQLYRIDSIESVAETASLGRHGSFTGLVQAPMAGPSSRRARHWNSRLICSKIETYYLSDKQTWRAKQQQHYRRSRLARASLCSQECRRTSCAKSCARHGPTASMRSTP